MPPKNYPAHTATNNCSGSCMKKVIQPIKTGRTQMGCSPLANTVPSPRSRMSLGIGNLAAGSFQEG